MNPFTPRPSLSIASLGESGLIESIKLWLGDSCPPSPHGIGDDCAVVEASRNRQLLTVDPVIYGRHFDDTVRPRDAGAKLLKRNLSDLAAMGAEPTCAVVALALDPRVRKTWLEQFYRGLAAAALRYRVKIVGGDLAQMPGGIVASLTLLGEASGNRILTRTGARVGDGIFVTGKLGRSLQSGHHVSFSPRLAEGAWLSRRPEIRSMMDVSDGLAKDLRALTPAGCEPGLFADAVPRRRRATFEQALCDGEDYELLFTVDSRADSNALLRSWSRKFPTIELSRIGQFVARGQRAPDMTSLDGYRGYEHLRDSPSHSLPRKKTVERRQSVSRQKR